MEYGQPLNGDHFAQAEIELLCRQHKIQCIIETGTYHAESTVWFASLVPHVLTFEANYTYAAEAQAHLDHLAITNVGLYQCESAQGIRQMGRTWDGPMLAFLDAHWHQHNPLLDEIQALYELHLPVPPIICIHDHQTADPDLGYDEFAPGVPISLPLVAERMSQLYQGPHGVAWRCRMNTSATAGGAKRGIGYYEPMPK